LERLTIKKASQLLERLYCGRFRFKIESSD